MERDDWTERELAEAESYSTTFKTAVDHIVSQLRTLPVSLSDEKRAAVELTVLLELAAEIGAHELRLSDDDFAVHACDVFTKTHHH
jgi:hypothetical protein